MPPKKSLIEIAEAASPGGGRKAGLSSGEERLELALAVIRNEITGSQAGAALADAGYAVKGGNYGSILGHALWTAARRGTVKVTRAK